MIFVGTSLKTNNTDWEMMHPWLLIVKYCGSASNFETIE